MAEALFRRVADEKGFVVAVSSAGTSAERETAAHAKTAVKKYNADLSRHIPTQLDGKVADDADLILTMTSGHLRSIPEASRGKAFRLKDFASGGGIGGGDVSDPVGGPLPRYEACAAEIRAAILQVIDRLDRDGRLVRS